MKGHTAIWVMLALITGWQILSNCERDSRMDDIEANRERIERLEQLVDGVDGY